MNVTNVPSRLRRYRANNPYTHTLLFFFLDATWTVLKIVLVGAALFALWVVSNKWMTSQQKSPQEAAVLVKESSQQLESAEVGSDDDAADLDSDAIETDQSINTNSAVNAKPETPVASAPTGNTAATSESVTEITGANDDTVESQALKISAYSAVLFSSISDDDAKQTLINKDSTVLFIERQGEWIKVTTVDKRETGYVHSSQVIAD